MKLVLLRSDFVRCQILSRKINRKAINEAGLEKLKVQFYQYMIEYYIHEKEDMEVAKAYQTIFDTINKISDEELAKNVDPDGQIKKSSFRNFVIYLLLSPYDNDKVQLLNVVEAMYGRQLDEEELIAKYVRKLKTYELMPLDEAAIEQQMIGFEPF